uniref:hypothetical protein n=1 Tax=Clostridium perfringens TaxID=1502 RepID=UPI0039EACF17
MQQLDNSNYQNTVDTLTTIHPEELKALFNIFNGRPDSTTRIFPKDVLITIPDLFLLRDKMNEKLDQYALYGSIQTLDVRFEGNKFQQFSDWSQFESYNWSSSNVIDSITLKWDFMIKFNSYSIPQRHTVVVRLSSELRPEQLFQMMISGKIEDLDSIDKNLSPVMCSVSFVNQLISEEILNIVEEWDKGLKQSSNINNRFKFFRKHKLGTAKTLEFVTNFSGIVIITSLINFLLYKFKLKNISELTIYQLQLLLISFASSYIFLKLLARLAHSIGKNIFNSLSQYGDVFTFKITKGDEERQELLKLRNSEYTSKITNGFIFGIVINIVCG